MRDSSSSRTKDSNVVGCSRHAQDPDRRHFSNQPDPGTTSAACISPRLVSYLEYSLIIYHHFLLHISPFFLHDFSRTIRAILTPAMSSQGVSFRADILGLPNSTASPKDSTLVIIDAQNEYALGKLKVSNVASSRKAIKALLEKYRSEGGELEKIFRFRYHPRSNSTLSFSTAPSSITNSLAHGAVQARSSTCCTRTTPARRCSRRARTWPTSSTSWRRATASPSSGRSSQARSRRPTCRRGSASPRSSY